MINALVCAYKSGDVIGLALRQLVDAACVTRILVADGPHKHKQFGHLADTPSVRNVVESINSPKIVYEYSDDCGALSEKCNRILKQVSPDCEWVLVVDSDEVHHETALARLPAFLATAEYGRYSIKTLDLYPDFHHFIKIPDWKPRLYRWSAAARCGAADDEHQYVLHWSQKQCPGGGHYGLAKVPTGICTVYHLNALRHTTVRLELLPDGSVKWKGGGQRWTSEIYPFHIKEAPKSIRDLGRPTL